MTIRRQLCDYRHVSGQVLVDWSLVMSVRRDRKYGHWLYGKQIRLSDGRTVRIFGVPTTIGLPDTKAGAERAERLHLERVLKTGEVSQTPPPPKECPKVSDFVSIYLDASRLQNKPASVDAKEVVLRHHIVPAIGHLRLDQVTYAVVEDLKLALSRKPAHFRNREGAKPKRKTKVRKLGA